MALLALGLLAVSTLLASGAPLPIWSSNKTSNFVFLRSPDFTFRAEATSAVLSFTAVGSPRPPEGTTQAKLLGAASIYVNGVLASAGPGHNVPTQPQVVRSLDGERKPSRQVHVYPPACKFPLDHTLSSLFDSASLYPQWRAELRRHFVVFRSRLCDRSHRRPSCGGHVAHLGRERILQCHGD